jgi:hypothetical protein
MAAPQEPEPGRDTGPIPRDMPDQQAGTGEDPWEVTPGEPPEEDKASGEDVPDGEEPSA